MAVPAYTEDLTDIDLAESTTGWNAYGGGAAGLGTGADFAIQGALAVDKQITGLGTIKGMMHNDATITLGANDHIWGWIFAATPGIIATLANGGKRMSIGTGTTARNDYYLEGSDDRPEGGNKCYCVRYTTSTPSPGSQTGTPGATPTYFGAGLHTTATAKAANLGVDAFRYGTGAFITAGDGASPATFAGFATQDELNTNKWGILFRVNGVFQLQGRFVVGQNNAGTATAAHFDDASGAIITLTDTPHSLADFTQIIIDHSSTIFNLTGATFISLGTNNPGKLVITDASATSTGFDTCVFRDLGTIDGHVNIPYNVCSFISCDQITQNNGDFADCVVEASAATSALLSGNPGKIANCSFISAGTGHAIEIDTAGTYTFTGNVFSGYSLISPGSNLVANSGSTDAMIYNNSGGAVTINVGGGGDTPTVRNGASATTTVNNNKTVTFTGMKNNTEVRIYKTSDGTEVDGIEDATAGTSDNRTFAWSAAAGLDVFYVIHHWSGTAPFFLTIRKEDYIVPSSDTTIEVNQQINRNAV